MESSKLGLWTGYFFSINSIVGAGFLTIPWAFIKGGWGFSTYFLILSAIQSLALCYQLFDIMSKVELILKLQEEGHRINTISCSDLLKWKANAHLMPKTLHTSEISSRRLDISQCVSTIFGKKIGSIYVFLLCISIQSTQLAYASIFASSFASIVPIAYLETCDIADTDSCKGKYLFWLALYSLITLYFVAKGLNEQKIFQMIMSFMRFLVMIVVIVCCAYAALTQNYITEENEMEFNSINLDKIGLTIPVILFAFMYQVNIPTIAASCNPNDLVRMAIYAILTCTVFYFLLGIIVPLGAPDTPSMSSLVFKDYDAGLGQRQWWTYIIEYLVILFPALDVLSAFPLFGCALADNILTTIYENQGMGKLKYYAIRISASLPPLVIAAFVYDLGTILDWAGLIVILIVLISVPCMELAITKLVPEPSSYQSLLTSKVRSN